MRVLLDTCVLSEINKQQPNKHVIEAIGKTPEQDIFISIICIGEITKGIDLLIECKKKQRLRDWLLMLEKGYSNRILTIDLSTVKIWGEITATAQKKGQPISVADGLIAASALRHNLQVMTRNVKNFKASGVSIFNPWND